MPTGVISVCENYKPNDKVSQGHLHNNDTKGPQDLFRTAFKENASKGGGGGVD